MTFEEQIAQLREVEKQLSSLVARINGLAVFTLLQALESVRQAIQEIEEAKR